jgi:putative transposase
LYRRHRFPGEIISHCAWLYFRFCLSYRDIELMMAERGIVLIYESVRRWVPQVRSLLRQLVETTESQEDRFEMALDEVFIKINGVQH